MERQYLGLSTSIDITRESLSSMHEKKGNKLILLGTKGGPAIRPNGSMPTSSLLLLDGQKILVDAGLGVTRGLVNSGFDLKTLSAIFITHLHSDHILELGPLIHTAWATGLKSTINIYGPSGLVKYWNNFIASMALDIDNRISNEDRTPLEKFVKIHSLSDQPIVLGKLQAFFLEVPHPPMEECYAFKIVGSKSITFSGDTHFFPPLADFATNSDILVHEAILTDYIDTLVKKTGLGNKLRNHLIRSHTPLEKVMEIARIANCRMLILNHLIPNDDPAYDQKVWVDRSQKGWSGKTLVGRDGLEIKF